MGGQGGGCAQGNGLESRRGVGATKRGASVSRESGGPPGMETLGEAGLARVSADWLLMPCGLGHPFLLWASLPSAARVGEGFPTSWGVRSGLSPRPRTKHLLHPTPALLTPRRPAQQAPMSVKSPAPSTETLDSAPWSSGDGGAPPGGYLCWPSPGGGWPREGRPPARDTPPAARQAGLQAWQAADPGPVLQLPEWRSKWEQ